MKKIFCDKRTLKSCKIYNMLRAHAKRKHVSFHTPGHKAGDWDITELSYSDNLSCPKGVIAEAERDISALLHSHRREHVGHIFHAESEQNNLSRPAALGP